MTKVSLGKYVKRKRIKKKDIGKILTILRKSYNWMIRDIADVFMMKHKEVVPYFDNLYKRMTIEEFDKLCSMMPEHEPKDIILMIVNTSENYGFISKMAKTLDKVVEIKETITTTEREKELQTMLDDIIYAEDYDKKMEAITRAYNKENNISFKI